MSNGPINMGAGSSTYRPVTSVFGQRNSPFAAAEFANTEYYRPSYMNGFGQNIPMNLSSSAASSAASSSWSFTPAQNIGFASQAISGILGNIAANRANKQGARALREQAGIYDSMAGVQLGQADIAAQGAGMYAKQAAAAADLGRGNARNIRLAAAQLDRYEQLNLREAVLNAKRRIGHGRAGFAANGVLVDSGSAAMWEQDEAADAALERLDIMQQYEDRAWTYLMQANKAEAEGYAAAAQQMGAAAAAAGQAAQVAGEAYASRLQAASARAQAARLKKKKSWGATIGTVLGAGVGAALAPVTGGASLSLALAGSAVGGTAGGIADAFA